MCALFYILFIIFIKNKSALKKYMIKLNKEEQLDLKERHNIKEVFLTNSYGPIGNPKRDDYEKLTSGKLFRSKYFKVIIKTKNWDLEI